MSRDLGIFFFFITSRLRLEINLFHRRRRRRRVHCVRTTFKIQNLSKLLKLPPKWSRYGP